MRTDREIIDETNELARYIMAELIGNTGYRVPDGHKFYEAEDPRSKKAWQHAVAIMEMTTKTEMADALLALKEDEAPVLRRYGVRLSATFRACAETEVEAFNFDSAVEMAKGIKHSGFRFNIEDGPEGDETMMVYGPDDDDPNDAEQWGGDGVEIEKRADGEPYSWTACEIVKELASFHDFSNPSFAAEKLKDLVKRAHDACQKEG